MKFSLWTALSAIAMIIGATLAISTPVRGGSVVDGLLLLALGAILAVVADETEDNARW